MLDEFTTIWRHQLLITGYKDILMIDTFPKTQYAIPDEIQSQLESILSTIGSDPTIINEQLINFSEILNQYGHNIHPYITSSDISKLISLLEFPDLQENLIPILWTCSLLSPDIIGYFLETDSFVQNIISIFFTDINLDTKLIIIKLLICCLSQFNKLTTILIDKDFFNDLLPFCENSNDFTEISSILLSRCKIDQKFVNSAFPIMQFIATNSDDPYSISRVLYIFSKSNGESDSEGLINQFIISEYIDRLSNFLINETFIVLIDAIVTVLNSIVSLKDIDTIKFFYSCNMINLVIDWIFKVNEINSDNNENNKLSVLILSFLNNLLENSTSDDELLSSFVELFIQNNFIEFCKVSSFIVYEKITLLILDTIIISIEGVHTRELLSDDFLELLIQLFELTESENREEICVKLHHILLFYQNDEEFCNKVNSMWLLNDFCANHCSDLIKDSIFNTES